MNSHARILVVFLIAIAIGVQTGCDQNEIPTDPESSEVVGKGTGITDLGERLAKDADFKKLQQLLRRADRKARLKYFAGVDLEIDLAFAKRVEREGAPSASDKKKLSEIRGLSEKQFQTVQDLRNAIIERFPVLLTLTKEELHDALSGAGVGHSQSLGKTFDACDDCNYTYNSCISGAEFRHAIEVISCSLLIQTVYGGAVCYLASVSKYMYTISSCSRNHQYCLSSRGCLNPAEHDTA